MMLDVNIEKETKCETLVLALATLLIDIDTSDGQG